MWLNSVFFVCFFGKIVKKPLFSKTPLISWYKMVKSVSCEKVEIDGICVRIVEICEKNNFFWDIQGGFWEVGKKWKKTQKKWVFGPKVKS